MLFERKAQYNSCCCKKKHGLQCNGPTSNVNISFLLTSIFFVLFLRDRFYVFENDVINFLKVLLDRSFIDCLKQCTSNHFVENVHFEYGCVVKMSIIFLYFDHLQRCLSFFETLEFQKYLCELLILIPSSISINTNLLQKVYKPITFN